MSAGSLQRIPGFWFHFRANSIFHRRIIFSSVRIADMVRILIRCGAAKNSKYEMWWISYGFSLLTSSLSCDAAPLVSNVCKESCVINCSITFTSFSLSNFDVSYIDLSLLRNLPWSSLNWLLCQCWPSKWMFIRRCLEDFFKEFLLDIRKTSPKPFWHHRVEYRVESWVEVVEDAFNTYLEYELSA